MEDEVPGEPDVQQDDADRNVQAGWISPALPSTAIHQIRPALATRIQPPPGPVDGEREKRP